MSQLPTKSWETLGRPVDGEMEVNLRVGIRGSKEINCDGVFFLMFLTWKKFRQNRKDKRRRKMMKKG